MISHHWSRQPLNNGGKKFIFSSDSFLEHNIAGYKIQTFIGLIPVEKILYTKNRFRSYVLSLKRNTFGARSYRRTPSKKILNVSLTTTTHAVTAHCTERPSNAMRSFRSKTEKTFCSTCHDTLPEQCLQAIPVCQYG